MQRHFLTGLGAILLLSVPVALLAAQTPSGDDEITLVVGRST